MKNCLEMNLSDNCSRIVKYLFEGLTITQISKKLKCTTSNVSYHINSLYKKYNAKNRSEFILSVIAKILDKYKQLVYNLQEKNINLEYENQDLKKILYNLLLNTKNSENLKYWISEAKKYF